MEDVRLVEDVRKALGDDAFLYVDGNGSYTEGEARTILARVADYNAMFIEEPCKFTDPLRQAAFAPHLPVPLLGDQCLQSLEDVQLHIRLGAVGAVSIKLRRTGFTQSLKIAALAEAAGLPVVIGTDSESRIGSMARMHFRAALPWLAPYPAETHFFDKLADDAFAGEFNFKRRHAHADRCAGIWRRDRSRRSSRLSPFEGVAADGLRCRQGKFPRRACGRLHADAAALGVRRAGVSCLARSVPRMRRGLRQSGIRGAAAGRRHAGRHARHLHDDAAGTARRSFLARRQHGVDRQQPRLRLRRGRADGDGPASGTRPASCSPAAGRISRRRGGPAISTPAAGAWR